MSITSLIRIVLYAYLFLLFIKANSQNQISFRQLSVKKGLSQNSVVSITQDSIGYLWIATQNGLNKYDGKKFTNYKYNFVDITRPTHSHLGKVYVDRKGTVFIIPVDRKLYKYNTAKNLFEPIKEVSDASFFYQDKNDSFWIGTYKNGLYFLDSTLTNLDLVIPPEKLPKTIYDISQQSKNELIITTEKKIVEVNINSKEFKVIEPESLIGEKIDQNFSTSLLDENGKQWIGTFGDGLYYRTPNNNTLYRISQSEFIDPLPNNLNILDLHLDHRNRLWIATYGTGLYSIDFQNKRILHFTAEKYNPRALHYNDVLCIYEDYTGTLWFGTDGAGLSYYDEFLEKFNSFTNLQTPENINIDVVRAIAVDNMQNVWLGTSGKGLTEYEPSTNSWRTFTTLNSKLTSDRIMSLLLDDSNDLWIGTQGEGLTIYNEKKGFKENLDLDVKTIWNIFKDSKDNVWLGSQNEGLILFDKNRGVLHKYLQEVKNIRVIIEDNDHNLWIGTDTSGIVKFNPSTETITPYEYIDGENSLSSNGIKSLHYDGNNILWIGTNGNGLNALDTKTEKFYHFTEKDGLANDVIYAILPDEKENLWLSSNKGISKFSVEDFTSPSIKNYNNYTDLATEFNTGAYFKANNNNLYFGGLEGFYWFDPNQLKINSFESKTVITDIKVFNDSRNISEKIPLKHTQNTISFTFVSMQFSQPELNQYKYRLVGHDEDWLYSESNNEVRYTNLPPGKYRFEVKSSNYDGVWSDLPATYDFEIEQPWHFTNMAAAVFTTFIFQGCFIAIGLFMLLLFIKLRKKDYLLYGIYILLFAGYFFLRIDLELQTALFLKDSNAIYYILTPVVFLVTGIFIAFINSFAEIEKYNPKFSKEITWFAFATYALALLAFLYLVITNNFDLMKNHLNLILLPIQVYGIYAVIRAFVIVKSPLKYYILLGNIFLIGFTMLGVSYGSNREFSGGVEVNNLLGFYSFNVSQVGVFLEMIVFSLGLGHKFYLVEIEKDRVEKLNELKTKLYTDIAHEFRTPLTLIAGPIDAKLKRGKLSDYDYVNFSTIKRNTSRLTGLVDQLLQLAKLERGKLKLTIAQGNLGLFLSTISESFHYKASLKQLDYKTDIRNIDKAWYDEDAVEKIVSNLIANAIKYTPDNGFCNVKARRNENKLQLEIKNSIEIDSELDLEKLFERFYQKDTYSDGAGVGLSLVKELIKLCKGEVNVTQENNSITFFVTLPLSKEVFKDNEVIVAAKEEVMANDLKNNIDLSDETTQNKDQETPILLIVEDNNDVRAFIKTSLQHKYQIIEGVNGKDGKEKALEFIPDIILSDVRMPEKDGIELCNVLKTDERTSHIPIILLTADTAEDNELKGLESGADDFITKPFKLQILEKRLENLITSRKALRNRYSQEFILKPTDISITSTDEAFLNKLQEIIDADFYNPDFNAVKFSKKINMSRMQLHRKLLAYTGLSTSAFIRSQRLKQAIKILKTSDATINEIAYTVGFNTPSYFIKCFKETYKKTPSEYLQSVDR